jgi:hypothetical protein
MSGSMYKKPGPNLPALSGRFWIFFHNVVEIAENSVKPTEIRPIKSGGGGGLQFFEWRQIF